MNSRNLLQYNSNITVVNLMRKEFYEKTLRQEKGYYFPIQNLLKM